MLRGVPSKAPIEEQRGASPQAPVSAPAALRQSAMGYQHSSQLGSATFTRMTYI